jgi:hypothetical protein
MPSGNMAYHFDTLSRNVRNAYVGITLNGTEKRAFVKISR